jgi:site-specific recombinase XerD
MAQVIREYLAVRQKQFSPVKKHDPLFVTFRLVPISGNTLWKTFQEIISAAGIESTPCRSRPRLHDLRHTFAVHRLLRWYQEGVDVQSKLLQLSTFMGHSEIHSTQIYLTITNELLEEANKRFYKKFGTFFKLEI